jgi:hypothetical protein
MLKRIEPEFRKVSGKRWCEKISINRKVYGTGGFAILKIDSQNLQQPATVGSFGKPSNIKVIIT